MRFFYRPNIVIITNCGSDVKGYLLDIRIKRKNALGQFGSVLEKFVDEFSIIEVAISEPISARKVGRFYFYRQSRSIPTAERLNQCRFHVVVIFDETVLCLLFESLPQYLKRHIDIVSLLVYVKPGVCLVVVPYNMFFSEGFNRE